MTVAPTLSPILYGAGPPLFIIHTTTATARAPAMKVFSGILLVLDFAHLTITAATGHHIYTQRNMLRYICGKNKIL
jgi:hypothetical protein